MADHPQDRQSPTRAAAAPPAVAVNARDVVAYLRDHPDFLDRHPDALKLLRPPSRDGGDDVLDFQHFMLERLRRDLARLEIDQRNLISTSRGNLASQSRVHKGVLAMMRARSFEQLLQIVTTDLAVLTDVDVVTLCIESTASPTTRLPMNGIHLLKAGTVEALLGPTRDVLLCPEVHGEAALFGAAAGLVRSQALLRLSFGRAAPNGLMCIGARKPGIFHPGLGTELLAFLAHAVEITIAQWLNLER